MYPQYSTLHVLNSEFIVKYASWYGLTKENSPIVD